MKITTRKKEETETKVADLERGIVFAYNDGTIGLKTFGGVFLLAHSDHSIWLDMAAKSGRGFLRQPVAKVLGQISEIIVE